MWLLRLSELNCVNTKIRRSSELRQLLIGMSISRYLPPMGTAGLLRCSVSGASREPRPPPRMIPRTSSIAAAFWHARAPGASLLVASLPHERRRLERRGREAGAVPALPGRRVLCPRGDRAPRPDAPAVAARGAAVRARGRPAPRWAA